jgi:uncharacterized protein YndB with AHSA1/START domain
MNAHGRFLDEHTVRFERDLSCPLDTAWSYLTQPGRLATWLAEGSIETRVGGRVSLGFDVEELPERKDGGAFIEGVVTLCVQDRVLAYTWTDPEAKPSENEDPDPTVTFELEPQGQHTKLVLTHRHLPTEALARCAAGWHTHLEVLSARIQNRQQDSFLAIWKRLLPSYEQQVVALR